jgi:murein L,D-transpeptidase YafK
VTGRARIAVAAAAALGLGAALLAGAGRAAPPPAPCAAPAITVRKAARQLELACDGTVRARYRVSLGRDPRGPKQREGDGRTPEGDYYVCTRNERSAFHLFLGLSYPGPADADRGVKARRIGPAHARAIAAAHAERRAPPWNTALGGAVGIHGIKRGWGFLGPMHRWFDWTNGCIALADHEIETLWQAAPLGTPVKVVP